MNLFTPEQEKYIQFEVNGRMADFNLTHPMVFASDKSFFWFKIACILYVIIRTAEIHFWRI